MILKKHIIFFQTHRFVANAQFEDGPIFQAEGSNKKEARTKAADMALRQVSKSTVVQVRHNETHEQSIKNGQPPKRTVPVKIE